MSISINDARSFSLALAIVLIGAGAPARGQLIDPNNNCVYRPGSTACEPIAKPVPPQPSGPPYAQFEALARDSNVDLRLHPTYTEQYFNERARLFCSLLAQGELMKIVREISFPPVVNWTETPRDRPRLETAILRVGALNYCKNLWSQEQQIEASITRQVAP